MIIVNSPGKGASLYTPLIHAKWFGFTAADIVFPSFLFAMGNAMSFSIKKEQHLLNATAMLNILKRTFLIFIIGYLLYWFPFVKQSPDGSWIFKAFEETRIMGVLQRIAICYFISVLIVHYFKERFIVVISLALLVNYWAILYAFGDPHAELTMQGNAIRKLDLGLFGLGHIYKRDSIPFDPEGLLSTMPAVVNVLCGYLAGTFIRENGKSFKALFWLFLAGTILILMALIWDGFFPISKKLWTGSFVFLTSGIDLAVLAMLIYSIEVTGWKHGVRFFTIFGKNPLFIYVFSELLYILMNVIRLANGQSVWQWISTTIFQQTFPGSAGSLLAAITFMMVCWATGWWLDKKKVYIRL